MLLGNYSVLNRGPLRWRGGSGTSPEVTARSAYSSSGALRNRKHVEQTTAALVLVSWPSATSQPYTWSLAQTAGAAVARRSADFSVTPAGSGGLGMPGDGAAAFAITTNTPDAQLIVSGSGVAAFTIAPDSSLLTASLNGAGSAAFTLQAAPAQLGAEANGTGSASFAVTGSLEPYAIGSMSGSTVDTSLLTSDTIATAVWQAPASVNNTAGTMGAKLNSAASGGVDYASMADAVRTELQAELLRIVELAQLHGLVVGTDLVVTPTSRNAGSVVQTVAESGGTVTVTRAP